MYGFEFEASCALKKATIKKMSIYSDSSFYYLFGDIYLDGVLPKITYLREISRKAPKNENSSNSARIKPFGL